MNLNNEEKTKLERFNADDIFCLVGYFPECRSCNSKKSNHSYNYPAGNINLKYGYQNPTDIHNGFGVNHIVYGAHTQDTLFNEVECIEDIAKILKKHLKKRSSIFMESDGNFIVISNRRVKIILKYDDKTSSYSVITCHTINNTYNKTKHGDQIGKIKKDLSNEE